MIRVKATREGLVGQKTSIGWVIDTLVSFVALPSFKALRRAVIVRNPLNGLSCEALVLDVGPWNEHDDDYVFNGARPLSENGISISGHGTNHAGIDLGEYVWHTLAMIDNGEVEWEFATYPNVPNN